MQNAFMNRPINRRWKQLQAQAQPKTQAPIAPTAKPVEKADTYTGVLTKEIAEEIASGRVVKAKDSGKA